VLFACSCSCADEEGSVACREYIARILAIQDERQARGDELNEVLQRYENDEIEREPMLAQSHAWQARENELRTKVSDLYHQARLKDCL